ncbi:hypothetical protein V2J09_014681 [Rumex salicifolius]
MRKFTWAKLFLALFGVLAITAESFVSEEVWALNNFKEAIYEDPFLVISSWNGLDPDPCQWSGVFCSVAKDHVVKLNISMSSLKGFLAPELGLLTYLEELILHGNNLIGTIPKEIGMLKHLKVLDLGQNQLTGPIPSDIGNLTNVTKMNLESNGLTGAIPIELANLKNLQELRLDRNKLQGTVPGGNGTEKSNSHEMYSYSGNVVGLCRLPKLKDADFSYNFLIGYIPKCLQYLPRTSFRGNCLEEKSLKQRPTSQCAAASSPPVKSRPLAYTTKHGPQEDGAKHPGNSKPTWILAVEIGAGIMVGGFFLAFILIAFKRCNKNKSAIIIPWKKSASDKDRLAVYIDSEALKDVPKYSRQDLEVACEDFSNIIGSSPDSMVYKGNIKGGPEIAVISFCIKEEQWSGYHELYFQREVADLARLNHGNTGKLLGYCRESSPFTRMLVFEYASYGTLSEHLHFGDGCQLTWPRRMKIITGIAKGLKYLHTELDPPFTISELNSNSVYLTEEFSPKVVDFASWKTILARPEKSLSSEGSNNGVAISSASNSSEDRTPENVHAFGVLILEIISGRPPHTKDNGSLVDWASDYLELPEAMSYVVDPQLKHFEYEDLKTLCEVASRCVEHDINKRPRIDEVCTMLESRIKMSISAELRSSSLAWAELALDS